jgi:hypothetical protein
LQENNAMAILDLETMEINVRGLGFKSWADHMMETWGLKVWLLLALKTAQKVRHY